MSALDIFGGLTLSSAKADDGSPDVQPSGEQPSHDQDLQPPPEWDSPVITGENAPTSKVTGVPCEVCSGPVEWSGRGRKAKNCLQHRTRTKPSAAKEAAMAAPESARTATAESDPVLAEIIGDLQEGLGMIAVGVGAFAPITGGTMLLTGPGAIDALVGLAAPHPRLLAGLAKAAKVMPFMEIGKFAGGVVVALQVDFGRLAPEGLAAEYLGVAHVARQLGWEPPQPEGPPIPTDGFNIPTPQRFNM